MVEIAIVDDDEAFRTALASLIRSFGYTALVYSSAIQFLAGGLQNAPTCMILDVQMPSMTGPELQRRLVKDGVDVPLIFMTSDPSPDLEARVMTAGAYAMLAKPCDADTLERCIKGALRERR